MALPPARQFDVHLHAGQRQRMAQRDQLAVLLAAMMPASRAACSGSPFFTAPARISRRAAADT